MNEKITCRELAIVDEEGNEVIWLSSDQGHHYMVVGKNEAKLSLLVVNGSPRITFERNGRHEMYIFSHESGSEVVMMDSKGLPGVQIRSNPIGCSIELFKEGQIQKRFTI